MRAAVERAPSEATGSQASPLGAASRMVSAGLEASLEQFNDPQLLADGKINVISL